MKKKIYLLLSLCIFMLLYGCGASEDVSDETDSVSTPAATDEGTQESNQEGDQQTAAGEPTSVTVVLNNSSFDLSPFGADGPSRDQSVSPLYGRLAIMPKFGATFEELENDMAKSITLSEDGKTVEIELYDYIHDNQGNPITASDVVFSYNTAVGMSGRNDFTRVNNYMESITATGDYTLEIVLKNTGVGVVETTLSAIPIISQQWYENASEEEIVSNPACTGSYYLTEVVTDASVKMAKVEDYWQEDSSLRPYIHQQPIDEIDYVVITEPSMVTVALENQEVDVALVQAADVYRFADDNGEALDGWSADIFSSSRFMALMFNCDPENGFFADKKELRQAICYAVDTYQCMIGSGQTDLSASVCKDFGSSLAVDFNQKWFDEDYYDYNIEKAKQLMADAGYPDGGLKLRLMVANSSDRTSMAAVIQSELSELGIEVEIISFDNALWSTYKTDFTQWDILIDSYSTTGYCSDAWNRLDHGDRNGVQDDMLQSLYEDSVYVADEASVDAFHYYLLDQAYAYGLFENNYIYIGQAGIAGWRTGRTANIEAAAFTYADDYQSIVKG